MGVYVDALRTHTEAAVAPAARALSRRNGHRWCHLIADTAEELHALAKRIGMKRAWFQKGDHYDLTPGRRAAALAAGATEIEGFALLEVLRGYREREGVARRRPR